MEENNIKKVSIVVLAYNHLDYTKTCIKSLLKYTLDIDYELIVVNNGSTDGTKEYFDTLTSAKKINLDNNIGFCGGFNNGFKLCEGEYILIVSNDLILTPRWASNLLSCIESDEKIGMVVPACNRSTYMQSVVCNYSGLHELAEFATNYNVPNPQKWEERLRLIGYTWIIKRDLFEEIGWLDENLNGAFEDDDLSFRVRRKGYKLIFARDTFVHHYGFVTIAKEYKENNLLFINRVKFIKKYNLDPWEGTGFDLNIVNTIDSSEYQNEINILGINPLCGGTILQMKNKFKEKNMQNINLFAFSEDERYRIDLMTICNEVGIGNLNDINKYFKNIKFDYIIIEKPIEQCDNISSLFGNLISIISLNGKIIFPIRNTTFYKNIIRILNNIPFMNLCDYTVKFINKESFNYNPKDIRYKNREIVGYYMVRLQGIRS